MKAIICALLSVIGVMAYATVWQVNNSASFSTDFQNLQDAVDSPQVAAGDTIYLYGSPVSYGNVSIGKQLYIIGPGYVLMENPHTQANSNEASFGTITFNTGSEHSVITGVRTSRLAINADNLTIKRNYIQSAWTQESPVTINGNSNILFAQNLVSCSVDSYYQAACIKINGTYTANCGLMFTNNIIYNETAQWSFQAGNIYGAVISNNFFAGSVYLGYCEFFNNIMLYNSFVQTNVNYHHNIGSDVQFLPNGINGNQCYANIANVIVGTGSKDGKFQLRAGSQAIGTGFNGTDIGPFGGSLSYVLSGMPSEIPSVYQYDTTAIGTEIPVQVGAKSHD